MRSFPPEIPRRAYAKLQALDAADTLDFLRVSPSRITAVLNGTRSVTADTAPSCWPGISLARYFNRTPQSWLSLQRNYELEIAKRTAGEP